MVIRKQLALLAIGLACMAFATSCRRNADKPVAQLAANEVHLENGMTETALLAVLGEPKGLISGGTKKTLMYDGLQIEILNGRVINLPDHYAEQLRDGRKEQAKKEALRAKQKKKGIGSFGERRTLTPKKTQSAPKGYSMRGKDNRPINHSRYVRRGSVTVIDFYADWCGPCRTLAPKLDKLIRSHDGVVLQKVDIGTWGSSIAEDYNVTSVPNVRVFDRHGNMVAPPTSSLGKIEANIKRAKKQ